MTKWILIVLAAMMALAVLGFVLDVAKALFGVAFFVLLAVLAFQLLWKKRKRV